MAIEKIENTIIEKFADCFAGDKKGFSAKEIIDYAVKFSVNVNPLNSYKILPKRFDLFVLVVTALPARQGFMLLDSLLKNHISMKYVKPSLEDIQSLTNSLYSIFPNNPIGLRYSKLTESVYREKWYILHQKIVANPSAAITSARSMLETMCRDILKERGALDNSSGDLPKLLKSTEKVLGFGTMPNQSEIRFTSGIASIINVLSEFSNNDGNRHGQIAGIEIDDPIYAELFINLCGSIGLYLLELHHFSLLIPNDHQFPDEVRPL